MPAHRLTGHIDETGFTPQVTVVFPERTLGGKPEGVTNRTYDGIRRVWRQVEGRRSIVILGIRTSSADHWWPCEKCPDSGEACFQKIPSAHDTSLIRGMLNIIRI